MHNALKQVHLPLNKMSVHGFSISGLATYMQIPEIDSCFDMGECPLSALPLNHIFLTHAHGDHSRCLMRHHSLRRMMGVEKEAAYYIPEFLYESAVNWIRAEAIFEGVPEHRIQTPNLIPLQANGTKVQLQFRKDLWVEAFHVNHSQPSLGYTLFFHKKKLLEKFQHLTGKEIAELRISGETITRDVFEPLLTFIGDCRGISLREQPHIWHSETLILECTFLGEEDRQMADKKGHTHLDEIVECLKEFGNQTSFETLILKHFSMKYSKEYILARVYSSIPEEYHPRIKVFL